MRHRASNIVVSTTEQLDGWDVSQYMGVVSAHVVAGTNLFSDLAASFSDIFGGRSSSYKKQLEAINEEAIRELKEKASRQGADAILGLKVDHDEISGQQKSMLMVTASGTAVRAERRSEPEPETDETGPVPARRVETETQKRKLLQAAEDGSLSLGEEEWSFLIENRVSELAPRIRKSLVQTIPDPHHSDGEELLIERAKDYFLAIDEEVAKKHLYNMLHDREPTVARPDDRPVAEWALGVIEEGRMLDFRWVKSLLNEDKFLARKRALEPLVQAEKAYYTESDLNALKELKRQVESGFEKKGEVVEVEESGMLSSETKEMWQIQDGKRNPMDREYCKHTGKNIYGFTRGETKPEEAAQVIRRRIEALEELL